MERTKQLTLFDNKYLRISTLDSRKWKTLGKLLMRDTYNKLTVFHIRKKQ